MSYLTNCWLFRFSPVIHKCEQCSSEYIYSTNYVHIHYIHENGAVSTKGHAYFFLLQLPDCHQEMMYRYLPRLDEGVICPDQCWGFFFFKFPLIFCICTRQELTHCYCNCSSFAIFFFLRKLKECPIWLACSILILPQWYSVMRTLSDN